MSYTVKQLATMAGVSARTLHYYDQIDLLNPARVKKNGYRVYEKEQLLRLQQILFFRELDFELSDIKKILDRPDFVIIESLRNHKKMIKHKQRRLEGLLKTINKTIKHMKDEKNMPDEELYNVLKDDDVSQYQEEVQQRWGDTEAYKQSMLRVGKMTKSQIQQLKDDGKKLSQSLADSMDKDVASSEVQELIAKHYKGIEKFYDCSLEMYRQLGQMYVDDSRFTASYDKFRPGLAKFIRDGISIYCDNHQSRK